MITLKDYNSNEVTVNPAMVQAISTFKHYDHDKEVPDKMMIVNKDGYKEVDPSKRDAVDALRTSERVIVTVGGNSIVVQGTYDEVKKKLS